MIPPSLAKITANAAAVIKAIGMPLNPSGTFDSSIRSHKLEKMNITNKNPSPEKNEKINISIKL